MAKETASVYIKINDGQVSNRIKDIAAAFTKAKQQANKAERGSKEYIKATQDVRKLGRILRDHNKTIGRTQSGWQKTKNIIAGVFGGNLLTSGVRVFTRAIADAGRTVADFQKANSDLNAVLGVTSEQTAELREQQIKLGSSTAFTASQAAEAQTELAKLGFTMDEITNLTPAVLNLAAASGTDLPNAATIAGSTMRQFNLDAADAGRVVDVMAKSFSSSALDIEKYKVAMAAAGPVAASAGVSLERTTALIGTLVDRGLDAGTAGTSLRNVFLALSESGMTYEEALDRIRNASDKNAEALALFGKRGATTGVILADTATQADTLTTAFENAAGAAQAMAETKLDNLTGDITKLGSAWEGLILSVENGEGVFAKAARSFIQGITDMVSTTTQAERVTGQLDEILGIGKFSDGFFAPEFYSTLEAAQTKINEFGDAAREAFAKGNMAGGAAEIEQLKALKAEYEGNEHALKLINVELNKLAETRNEARLDQLVGGVTDTVGTNKPTTPEVTTEDSDAAEEAAKALADKTAKLNEAIKKERRALELEAVEGRERELAQLDQHYADLFEKAKGHDEQLAELELLKQQNNDAINAAYDSKEAELAAQEQAKAQVDIENELLQHASEEEQVIAHYDRLILIAQEYGYREEELVAAKNAALKQLRDADAADAAATASQKAQQEIYVAQQSANALGSIITDLGSMQSKNAKFQADMAMYQQLINAGLSLSNAMASAKGVTPVDYLASLALVVGAITTRINQAKQETENAGAPPVPAFRTGTLYAPGGMAQINEEGEEFAYIPQGAKVFTANQSRNISGAGIFGPSFVGNTATAGAEALPEAATGAGADSAAIGAAISNALAGLEITFSEQSYQDFLDQRSDSRKYLGYRDAG
jgi:tetratricopeptide (TPR) repeat protein